MTSKASIDALRARSQTPVVAPAAEVEAVAAFVADLQAAHGQTAVMTKPPKGMAAHQPVAQFIPQPVPEAKESYSHEAMVRLMIANPTFTHGQLAGHFGRPAAWMSAVLASDAFQNTLDNSRHLILDPALTATLDERFRAVAIRSVHVLSERLNNPAVADLVVLKSAEIAIKALGVGILPAPATPAAAVAEKSIAEKLLEAMDARDQRRTVPNAADASDITDVEAK